MATEERSRQRFENFTRALDRLREALAIPVDEISDMERESLVQRFHYTFELAWQVLADRLEREGVVLDVATPRRAVREAFAAGLLGDGQTPLWLDMIKDHNRIVYQYDEVRLEAVVANVRTRYLAALCDYHARFAAEAVEA